MDYDKFEELMTDLGPDGVLNYDAKNITIPVDQIEWLVSHYTIGGYCGDGIMVCKLKNGQFKWCPLGHCSCYGPLEDNFDGAELSLDDLLSDIGSKPGDYDYECNGVVEIWIREKEGV